MAYQRMETADGSTIMSKKLYDNLQDSIDENKDDIGRLSKQIGDITFSIENDILYVETSNK